jgi:ParB family transcriptional regulator, chromosome partitioning protein
LGKGEERLISAVEAGQMLLAIAIAKSDDNDGQVQEVLQSAYESGALRGRKLFTVRRLIEKRRHLGKSYQRRGSGRRPPRLSSATLVRAYNREIVDVL